MYDNFEVDPCGKDDTNTVELQEAVDVLVSKGMEEIFITFLIKTGNRIGSSSRESWQMFCTVFPGVMHLFHMEPDMNLLNEEQREYLYDVIS